MEFLRLGDRDLDDGGHALLAGERAKAAWRSFRAERRRSLLGIEVAPLLDLPMVEDAVLSYDVHHRHVVADLQQSATGIANAHG